LNRFNQPTGVYVDENETLYVSDVNNHRVVQWSPGSLTGTIIAGNGKRKLKKVFFSLRTSQLSV